MAGSSINDPENALKEAAVRSGKLLTPKSGSEKVVNTAE